MRRLLSSWKQDTGRSWSPRTNLGPITEGPAPQVVNVGGAWEEPPGPRGGAWGRGSQQLPPCRPRGTDQVCTLRSSGGSWRHTETQPPRGPGIHRPPRLCAPHVQTPPRAGLCFNAAQGPRDGWLSPPTTGKEPSGVWVRLSRACQLPRTFCDKCTGRAAWLSCPPEAAPPGRSHTHPRL